MKILRLKVFTNKSNGQTAVHLPKKSFNKMPTFVDVKIPKEYMKKAFIGDKKW